MVEIPCELQPGRIPTVPPDIPIIPPGDGGPGGPGDGKTNSTDGDPGFGDTDDDDDPPTSPPPPFFQSLPGFSDPIFPDILGLVDEGSGEQGSVEQFFVGQTLLKKLVKSAFNPQPASPSLLYSDIQDKVVMSILEEFRIGARFNATNLQNISEAKMVKSLNKDVTDVLLNLTSNGVRYAPQLVIDALFEKFLTNENFLIDPKDIDELRPFSKPRQIPSRKSITPPVKRDLDSTLTQIQEDRSTPYKIPKSDLDIPFLTLEQAAQKALKEFRSLRPEDYDDVLYKQGLKLWYIAPPDITDSVVDATGMLPLRIQREILEQIGSEHVYTLEVITPPEDDEELEFNDSIFLKTHYILSIDESDITEQDSNHILVRNTRTKYDIVTDNDAFANDFKHKLFPYFVIYVNYNDPLLYWIHTKSPTVYFNTKDFSLNAFGDDRFVRQIFSHLIIIPTDKFSRTVFGGRSTPTTWGTRLLSVRLSPNDELSKIAFMNPLFQISQPYPASSVDSTDVEAFTATLLDDPNIVKETYRRNTANPLGRKRVRTGLPLFNFLDLLARIDNAYNITNNTITYPDIWSRMVARDFYGLSVNLSLSVIKYIENGNTGTKISKASKNRVSKIVSLKTQGVDIPVITPIDDIGT